MRERPLASLFRQRTGEREREGRGGERLERQDVVSEKNPVVEQERLLCEAS